MSTVNKIALVGAGVIGKHLGLVISQLADRLELAAVADIDRLRVDLETNRQSIAVITGVYESARTGRPVSLS